MISCLSKAVKNQKSLIANCPYEENEYVDRETGEIKKATFKMYSQITSSFSRVPFVEFPF